MNLGDLVVKLRADLGAFSSNLNRATSHLKTFSGRASAIMSRFASNMRRYARRAALVITAQMALAVRESAKFEEQMANVSTMLDQHTMHHMPRFTEAVRNMSIEFGQATEVITKGLYDILSASVAPAKAINVLGASMKAAVAGMTDTRTAADAITTVLNAYGLEAKYAALVSDRLFAIVKRGKLTFAEIAGSIGNVASTAALARIKFEVLGAAISTLTRAGIRADEAVTAVNALILGFIDSTPEAAVVAKKYGFAMNSAALHGTGLLDIMHKLQGASSEEIGALTKRIRGYKALAIGLRQAEGMTKDYEFSLKSAGITQEQYEKMTDTLIFQLRRLWSLYKVLMVQAIEPFKEDLKSLVAWTIRHKDAMIEWVRSVSEGLRSVLVFIGTEWQHGWEKSGDAIILIMKAAMQSVKVIVTDAMILLGRKIPGLLYQGMRLQMKAYKEMWKEIGIEIAKSINSGVDAVMGVFFGEWGNRLSDQLKQNLAEYEKDQQRTADSLAVIAKNLAADLKALSIQPYEGDIIPTSLVVAYKRAATTIVTFARKIKEAFVDLQKVKFFPDPEPTVDALEEIGDAKDRLRDNVEEVASDWESMWKRASGVIAGSMEDAFVRITKNADDARAALTNMLESIHEAITRAMFQQYLLPSIFQGFGQMGMPMGQTATPTMQGPAQPVVPMQAQRGLFVPRGVDTIPIMASPGEGLAVIPKGMVDWMKDSYEGGGAGGQPVNVTFNVNAIDAQGTAKFLQNNKRAITGVVGDAVRGNHPYRRSRR